MKYPFNINICMIPYQNICITSKGFGAKHPGVIMNLSVNIANKYCNEFVFLLEVKQALWLISRLIWPFYDCNIKTLSDWKTLDQYCRKTLNGCTGEAFYPLVCFANEYCNEILQRNLCFCKWILQMNIAICNQYCS